MDKQEKLIKAVNATDLARGVRIRRRSAERGRERNANRNC